MKQDFPALNQQVNNYPLVYLDGAASTLRPQSVIDSLIHYYTYDCANIHRAVHTLGERATASYEETREVVKNFIHAKSIKEIIFTKGTTEAINLLAHSFGFTFFKPGDEVLISAMEHHSNIVPWQLIGELTGTVLKVIPIDEKGELKLEEYQKLLNEKTKMVSFTLASNALGTITQAKEMIEMAHRVGAKVMVDAAQAMAHFPVDVQELDCDFLAFSGHKMYGPSGVGVLYGKEALLKAMRPYQGGGDMIESVTFEKTTYNQLPYKFEAGTPAIASVTALKEAIFYIQKIGFEKIMSHEQELLKYGYEVLKTVPGLRFIGEASHKVALFSFVLDKVHPHDIGTFMDQYGIALRTGHHCAQPVMNFFKVAATARASLSIYNTKEDLDHLAFALKKTVEFFS